MTDTLIWQIIIVLVLMFFSAIFSACETALTGVSRARMHALEKEGNKQAALVNKLREEKDMLIGAVLFCNNAINITASAVTTSVLLGIFGDTGVLYATIIMTVLIFVFAEVLPKTIALLNPDKYAMQYAGMVNGVVIVLSPMLRTVSKIIVFILRVFHVKNEDNKDASEEELRGAIELHQGDDKSAVISSEKRAMLHSILDLAEVDVAEIMTHRRSVETIDLSQPIGVIIEQVLDNAHTRLPVFSGNQDNIVGILHVKSLLREVAELGGDLSKLNISKLMTDPWFIPDSTILFDQLQAFRQRKEHFAIVVDEYGSFLGVVTLEDILEEIVGEIEDEHDITIPGVRPQQAGTFVVDGIVTIRDLNRAAGWNLPDEDYATVAGLVLYESKLIPDVGQMFSFFGYRFKILKRQRNQITLLRVTPEETV